MKKLIKQWTFGEESRRDIELGEGTRLSPSLNAVTLAPGALVGVFATSATQPRACRGWLLFQADVRISAGAGASYKLSTGEADWYWDAEAGEWAAAGADDWSTERQVAENISTFAWQSRTLKIRCRLTGTASAAPEVRGFKVLYDAKIDHQEDLVWRSLRRHLEDNLRPMAEEIVIATASQAAINIATAAPKYDAMDVIGVYNLDGDGDRLEDLVSSYNNSTKIATLSGPQEVGTRLVVEFTYKPVVAVTTDRLYHELASVPAVNIDSISEGVAKQLQVDDFVVDSYSGAGWRVKAPRMNDIECGLSFMTGRAKDQTRLGEALKTYFDNNFFVVSVGMDERYRLSVVEEEQDGGAQGQAQLYTGRFRIRIHNVQYYLKPAEQIRRVDRFNIVGSLAVTVGQPVVENAILTSGDQDGFYIAFSGDQAGFYEQTSNGNTAEPPPSSVGLSGDQAGFYVLLSGDQEGHEELSGDQRE